MSRPLNYISPDEAADAIQLMREIQTRLDNDDSALTRHLAFACDAVWAAAYPDDPYSMLNQIADAAADAE